MYDFRHVGIVLVAIFVAIVVIAIIILRRNFGVKSLLVQECILVLHRKESEERRVTAEIVCFDSLGQVHIRPAHATLPEFFRTRTVLGKVRTNLVVLIESDFLDKVLMTNPQFRQGVELARFRELHELGVVKLSVVLVSGVDHVYLLVIKTHKIFKNHFFSKTQYPNNK